jgi:hypothetical protein
MLTFLLKLPLLTGQGLPLRKGQEHDRAHDGRARRMAGRPGAAAFEGVMSGLCRRWPGTTRG